MGEGDRETVERGGPLRRRWADYTRPPRQALPACSPLEGENGSVGCMTAHRPRILVIDDEPQIHRFLGPALDAAGYEPLRADDGAVGLKAIASRPPDAVILDLGLPDMDGKQALERARAFYDGPILILSARDMEMEKIEALDLGADDYVEKPFHVGELLARLRVAMRHKLHQAGAPPVVKAGDVPSTWSSGW